MTKEFKINAIINVLYNDYIDYFTDAEIASDLFFGAIYKILEEIDKKKIDKLYDYYITAFE